MVFIVHNVTNAQSLVFTHNLITVVKTCELILLRYANVFDVTFCVSLLPRCYRYKKKCFCLFIVTFKANQCNRRNNCTYVPHSVIRR